MSNKWKTIIRMIEFLRKSLEYEWNKIWIKNTHFFKKEKIQMKTLSLLKEMGFFLQFLWLGTFLILLLSITKSSCRKWSLWSFNNNIRISLIIIPFWIRIILIWLILIKWKTGRQMRTAHLFPIERLIMSKNNKFWSLKKVRFLFKMETNNYKI